MPDLPKTVSDVMTKKVVTIGENDTLEKLEEGMQRFHFRHLPVVDESGALVGILSERDLLPLEGDHGASFDDPCVHDLMTADVKTVETEDTVHVAVRLFIEHRFGVLPVVEPGAARRLVGVLSPIDVLQAWHSL